MAGANPIDKRLYVRYEVLDLARLRIKGIDLTTVVTDVSLGGLQLRTRVCLPVDALCELNLPEGCQPLRVEIRHVQATSDGLFNVGLRFLPRSDEERQDYFHYVQSVYQHQHDLLVQHSG